MQANQFESMNRIPQIRVQRTRGRGISMKDPPTFPSPLGETSQFVSGSHGKWTVVRIFPKCWCITFLPFRRWCLGLKHKKAKGTRQEQVQAWSKERHKLPCFLTSRTAEKSCRGLGKACGSVKPAATPAWSHWLRVLLGQFG